MSDAVKGLLSEKKREQKGIDANSPGADASSSGANSSDASSADASDNVRYAIIQIDNGKITVLDTSNEQFFSEEPHELLENKLSSIFAIKITKKDCTETARIKCIEYGDANYELDLETVVKKEDAEKKLIDEKFLGSAVPGPASVPASESASVTKVSESGSEVPGPNASTSKPASEYNKDNIKDFFEKEPNATAFSKFLVNPDKNKFGENINYLKIAESVVINNIEIYGLERCQQLMGEAAAYAWSIIESSNTTPNDFSEILTAFEILDVVDPSNAIKKEKIDEINENINKKINGKNITTDIIKTSIKSKAPNYKDNIKLTGYTPVIVDKGGSGNCFYYSVWGGLKDLGQGKYNKIVTELTTFAKTLNPNSDVDFANTIDNKDTFNTNIRKLLAYCFLADTNDTFYRAYLGAWNNGSGVETVSAMANDLAYGLRTIIQAKCKEYENNNNTKFFTEDEFKNIRANNVITNRVFTTQIEVDMIKRVFSNCNVIIDIYSPKARINYNEDKLPTEFGEFSYIYVIHTGREHYQQIQTTTNKENDSTFTRENVSSESPFWKYVSQVKSGGSRKTMGPKLKKTKRKYYVYKK